MTFPETSAPKATLDLPAIAMVLPIATVLPIKPSQSAQIRGLISYIGERLGLDQLLCRYIPTMMRIGAIEYAMLSESDTHYLVATL